MTDDPNAQIAELQTAIAQLEQAIPTLAALPDTQRQLQAQLAEKQRALAALQRRVGSIVTGAIGASTGVAIGDGAQSSVTQGPALSGPVSAADTVNIATIQYIINTYPSAGTPDHATLLAQYLSGLCGECNRLSLADADSSDPTHRAVQLIAVYTRLEVASTVEVPEAERRRVPDREQTRQLTALEVAGRSNRLVLLGEPGSGKSTFVNFLALCLAHAAQGVSGWQEQLGEGWTRGPLLPVRVVLREFAAWLNDRPQRPGRGDALLFWAYLSQRHGKEVVAILRREIAAGRALLLLDGLDEVPADARGFPLTIVMATIESLAATAQASPLLLACRVLDYEQDPRRQLLAWDTERLIPFSPELRRSFIARWYDALAQLKRPLNGEPAMLRDQLQSEVAGRPELRRLAGNPLLLTMMARVHASDGRLPGERVRLYARCIEFLLLNWRSQRNDPPLREQLGLPQWGESELGRLLDRLGFAAHERGVAGDGEAGADLPRTVLVETARGFFARYGQDRDDERAVIFRRYIGRHGNGVLQQYGPDTYRFPHRTFQEFLAARRLVSDGDWGKGETEFVDRARRRAEAGPQWREALLLAVSQLVVVAEQLRPAVELVSELLQRAQRDVGAATAAELVTSLEAQSPDTHLAVATRVILAGELLVEIGRENLRSLGEQRDALWESTATLLTALITSQDTEGRSLLPIETRVRAGQALGQLGDPRVPVTSVAWQVASGAFSEHDVAVGLSGSDAAPDYLRPYWREVPAGQFLLGSDDTSAEARYDGKPQRTVDLPTFHIACYPVTNAQWKQFVDAGGYQDRSWWSEAGWAYIEPGGRRYEGEPERIRQPRFWDDLRFNGPNQPVVGISWYEAVAYCHWLTAQGHSEGWLPGELQLRLPSEAEWEKAARGDDGRIYPWGNEWEPERLNAEGTIGATTAVGCYPDGASPYVALDMSGNVLEWTATPWTSNYSQDDGTKIELSDGNSFVWRGGSWANVQQVARCAYRDYARPTYGFNVLGVRLVAAFGRVTSDE